MPIANVRREQRMKKSHPDEDKIPTLRDLVFPGNQELRRSQSHERERIEPQLASRDELESGDAPPHRLDDASAADPFILLPDENEQDWNPALSSEQIGEEPAALSYTGFPAAATDTPEADAVIESGDGDEQLSEYPADATAVFPTGRDDTSETAASSSATSKLSAGIEVEEEVSIEDLMTYFQHPKYPSKSVLTPPPGPLAPEDTPSAANQDAEIAIAPLLEETIRTAVRDTLEHELDRLTDIVTDAVIARLRK